MRHSKNTENSNKKDTEISIILRERGMDGRTNWDE